jgi:peptidoglycan hydrolase-like protein with peptidoglycan-binding domain
MAYQVTGANFLGSWNSVLASTLGITSGSNQNYFGGIWKGAGIVDSLKDPNQVNCNTQIRCIQKFLNQYRLTRIGKLGNGYEVGALYAALLVDGLYGSNTIYAVRWFQAAYFRYNSTNAVMWNLVDGLVGQDTWNQMRITNL